MKTKRKNNRKANTETTKNKLKSNLSWDKI